MTPAAEIFDVASLASLAVLGALALRKVFGGERFEEARFFLLVLSLTILLWLPVFYLFVLALPARPLADDCYPAGDGARGSFCIHV